MRIHKIHIQGYRVLDNFSLDFKHENQAIESHTLDLLVGVNGTGKSTLLQAIAEIFQRLEQGE